MLQSRGSRGVLLPILAGVVEGSRPRYAKCVSRLTDLHYQCRVQAGDSKRQRAEAGRNSILTISLYCEGRTIGDGGSAMKAASVKPVRCAIYTRVSTDHGLDQEFNSLDAQYEAASAYIKSQAHAGWTLIRSRYDDGGYSGGSTDRPDLQRLLDDIRARKIDVIVVYKVDRLTRSLADFAKLVELFDAQGVSFVSVTQQFNTTTSMGRLTLNVLLSFAQFEREVTSERIRDKIAASKRKGLWVGGPLPLGYQMKDGKIAVVEDEAERVRLIYRRYLELSGVNALVRDLKDEDIRTKIKLRATGATHGAISSLFECL